MFRLRRLPFLLLLILTISLAGCADKAAPVPTAPTAVTTSTAANVRSMGSETSGCYPVRFDAYASYPPGGNVVLTFTLSGDLVGTLAVTSDLTTFVSHGKTGQWDAVGTFTITDGVIPGLASFQASFDNMNLLNDRPGSPLLLREVIGTGKALSVVKTANLSYKGTTDRRVTPIVADFHYWGVICP